MKTGLIIPISFRNSERPIADNIRLFEIDKTKSLLPDIVDEYLEKLNLRGAMFFIEAYSLDMMYLWHKFNPHSYWQYSQITVDTVEKMPEFQDIYPEIRTQLLLLN